jgi:hypothetical protein
MFCNQHILKLFQFGKDLHYLIIAQMLQHSIG